MSKKFLFTIVLSTDTVLYKGLETGNIVDVSIVKNNNDPYAIGVFKDGVQIGFVANSAETVLPQTLSANRLHKLVSDNKVARTAAVLRTEKPFKNKAGMMQRRFLAEAFFVPKREKVNAEEKVLTYKVFGESAKNPQKASVLGEIIKAKDENRELDLTVEVVPMIINSTTVYKVFLHGNSSAGAACGEITEPDDELFEQFDAGSDIKVNAKVVGNITEGRKKGYTIQIQPQRSSIEKFFDYIDKTIERCVDQSPEIETKVQTMINSGFSEKLIKNVLEQMPVLDAEKANVPNPKRKYFQKNGSNLADMVAYMLFGKMIRLVGEKGAGKNTLVETACWLLNRPMCRIQGSSEMDKLDIQGSASLVDGNTGFILSEILTTLQNDGVVVLDEANSVRPDVLMLFHSLTDEARSINVPGYGMVHMGDHASIVYTLNEGYVGTGEMNPATIDRGPSIIVKQETDMKTLLSRSCPDAATTDIDTCVKVSEAIQKSINESGMLTSDAVTIRGFIDALECSSFIPLKRALLQNVANKMQTESERLAVENIISAFCA